VNTWWTFLDPANKLCITLACVWCGLWMAWSLFCRWLVWYTDCSAPGRKQYERSLKGTRRVWLRR
jgi:hypothetical protein